MHPYPQAHARQIVFLNTRKKFRVRHNWENKGNMRAQGRVVQIQIANCFNCMILSPYKDALLAKI